MMYVRFGDGYSAGRCKNLADVKHSYEPIGYSIFKQIHDGVLCFKTEEEHENYLKSQKEEDEKWKNYLKKKLSMTEKGD